MNRINKTQTHLLPPSKWQQGLELALQQGVINTLPQDEDGTYWPTMVLTFVGAFVAALFFFACFLLIAYQVNALESSAFHYTFGTLLAVGSLRFLCLKAKLPLFVEHLMFIMLAVGIGLIAAGFLVGNHFPREEQLFLLLSIMSAICAYLLPMGWARAIASFATACCMYTYLYLNVHGWGWRHNVESSLLMTYAYHLLLPVFAALLIIVQHTLQQRAHWKLASRLEPILNGWFVATTIILAYSVGMTMFVAGIVSSGHANLRYESFGGLFSTYIQSPLTWITLACLPLAWWWSAMRWPALKHWRIITLVIIITAFSSLAPELALCLSLGLMAVASQRYRLAVLACISALWVVGALYYSMLMPLLEKAMWLAITGAALLAIAWVGTRSHTHTNTQANPIHPAKPQPFAHKPLVAISLILLAAGASLGGVNANIWQQEQIRSQGIQVLIPLAPVDPRSLMQGDYMVLRFNIDGRLRSSHNTNTLYAYLNIDESGVAHLEREAHSGEPYIALVHRDGSWTLPADAWFFQEGDAKRWEAAKYGIFKVDAQGQSSLIGMATADLKAIDAKGHASNSEPNPDLP